MIDKTKKIKFQIYIMARDRVNYLSECINSALLQKSYLANIEIIVSDNSINNSVFELIKEKYLGINYIRRNPPLSAGEHFKIVQREANGDIVTIFHDDDILLPNYVDSIVDIIKKEPELSAIGTNAIVIDGDSRQIRDNHHIHKSNIIYTDKKLFLDNYLPTNKCGISPFPSYAYTIRALKMVDISFDENGKYADVIFLSELLNIGPIYWISAPLIKYRYHNSNWSNTLSIKDMRKLRLYMESHGIDRKTKANKDFKSIYWLKWINNVTSKESNSACSFKQPLSTLKIKIITHNLRKIDYTRIYYWKKYLLLNSSYFFNRFYKNKGKTKYF